MVRARTGHLKRHLQERGSITRLGAPRAATSEEIVHLLLLRGASGGCTAAAAAAAAAGCGASRLERGETAARKEMKPSGEFGSASGESTSVDNG